MIFIKCKLKIVESVTDGRVVSAFDCNQGGFPVRIRHPTLLKHTGHHAGHQVPSVYKAAHPGFETQRRRHQKSKTGGKCQVCIRLATLALKPREASPEVQNRGISGPTKGHM